MNQELKKGDRVMLLHMEDNYGGVSPGTWGTVTDAVDVMGVRQYGVVWDDGTKENPGKHISRLALLSDVDLWTTDGFRKKTNESRIISKKDFLKETDDMEREWERNKSLSQNKDVFKNFDIQFFKEFLNTLRESSIVNMHGASPYLYMGRDRIKHEFTYNEPPDEDSFERLLDMADESQAKMIDGVIKVLESKNQEADLNNINSGLRKYSTKILQTWILLYYH